MFIVTKETTLGEIEQVLSHQQLTLSMHLDGDRWRACMIRMHQFSIETEPKASLLDAITVAFEEYFRWKSTL